MTNTAKAITADEQLHLLLGRLVHAFGRLDFNLGCQLQGLGPYRGRDVDELLKAGVAFSKRLQMLELLVMEVYGSRNESAKSDFSKWFERVNNARALRNDFAHGRWGISGRHVPSGVRFEFARLCWDFSDDKRTEQSTYTSEELQVEVQKVEQLFNDFCELEKKYLSSSTPSLAWELKNQTRP